MNLTRICPLCQAGLVFILIAIFVSFSNAGPTGTRDHFSNPPSPGEETHSPPPPSAALGGTHLPVPPYAALSGTHSTEDADTGGSLKATTPPHVSPPGPDNHIINVPAVLARIENELTDASFSSDSVSSFISGLRDVLEELSNDQVRVLPLLNGFNSVVVLGEPLTRSVLGVITTGASTAGSVVFHRTDKTAVSVESTEHITTPEHTTVKVTTTPKVTTPKPTTPKITTSKVTTPEPTTPKVTTKNVSATEPNLTPIIPKAGIIKTLTPATIITGVVTTFTPSPITTQLISTTKLNPTPMLPKAGIEPTTPNSPKVTTPKVTTPKVTTPEGTPPDAVPNVGGSSSPPGPDNHIINVPAVLARIENELTDTSFSSDSVSSFISGLRDVLEELSNDRVTVLPLLNGFNNVVVLGEPLTRSVLGVITTGASSTVS